MLRWLKFIPYHPAAFRIGGPFRSKAGGDGKLAKDTALGQPDGIVVDPLGDVFISTYYRVRRVDHATGVVTTFAGGSGDVSQPLGDGGSANAATLKNPTGLVLDSAGNLFIADSLGDRVRRVDHATNIITTVAGTGVEDFAGDGRSAKLKTPNAVAIDDAGNLFISDSGNSRVRRVDAQTGTVTTVAGGGTFAGQDGGAASAATLGYPEGVAFDAAGNLLIGDTLDSAIRQVDCATGIITTIAGAGGASTGLAVDVTGAVFGSGGNKVFKLTPAGISPPGGTTLDPSIVVSPDVLRHGQVGVPYSVELTVNGPAQFITSLTPADLPPGVTVNLTHPVTLAVTPTYTFQLYANVGCGHYNNVTRTVVIDPRPDQRPTVSGDPTQPLTLAGQTPVALTVASPPTPPTSWS